MTRVMRATRRLHRRHASTTSQLPSTAGPFAVGATFQRQCDARLCWVYATLTDTALVAYELVLPPFSRPYLIAMDRETAMPDQCFALAAFLPRQPGFWMNLQACAISQKLMKSGEAIARDVRPRADCAKMVKVKCIRDTADVPWVQAPRAWVEHPSKTKPAKSLYSILRITICHRL
jgi:hypothetical protein